MLKSQRKRGARNESSGFPFPNFAISDDETPTVCTCTYNDDNASFLVQNTVDIQILYGQVIGISASVIFRWQYCASHCCNLTFVGLLCIQGGFGRSTVTMRAPLCFINRNYQNQAYYKKAKARGSGGIVIEEFRIPDVTMTTTNTNGGVVSEDNEDKDLEPADQEMLVDPPSLSSQNEESGGNHEVGEHNDEIDEALELMPEEVMFLTFGLGCLKVQTVDGTIKSPEDLWNDLVTRNPEFPIFYAVYHHFRCKNWIPKSGQSYGGDFGKFFSQHNPYLFRPKLLESL